MLQREVAERARYDTGRCHSASHSHRARRTLASREHRGGRARHEKHGAGASSCWCGRSRFRTRKPPRAPPARTTCSRARASSTSCRQRSPGCGFVAATTSRDRDQNFRVLDLHDAAQRIFEMSARAPAAVLFGAERTGLTNEELAARARADPHSRESRLSCRSISRWPCSSLLRAVPRARSSRRAHGRAPSAAARAPADMERFYAHLAASDGGGGFPRPHPVRHESDEPHPPLSQRAEMDQNEVNILRGFLTAVQSKAAARPARSR